MPRLRGGRSSPQTRSYPHPYLSGNFAPVHQVQPLTPCSFAGIIPDELAGGEYVRNGGNPVTNEAVDRDAHWFDGDGMLSGVYFRRVSPSRSVPEFVNQYILTDVLLSTVTSPALETPILPSITTLVNPLSPLLSITWRILRTLMLVLLSHLPGSEAVIRRISVANTSILYHDGRALATCESGVPMRVALPCLETVGWYNGRICEGEEVYESAPGFGGSGFLSFMKEWTTAHPRVDPETKELLLYHNTFIPPFVHYSVVPPTFHHSMGDHPCNYAFLLNAPVSGIRSAKMMHDFGVSRTQTIIMDLPLSLDPLNLLKNIPVVSYDPDSHARFGIFPRYQPERIRWFETRACCIFHTANSWDSIITDAVTSQTPIQVVNMLVCRLTSAALVFSAGDLAAPIPVSSPAGPAQEDEQCRLYFYQFGLAPITGTDENQSSAAENTIRHQWALSAIPFEFPSLRDSVSMSAAKYIYGCSMFDGSFGAALGRAVKINALVKFDVELLIQRGLSNPPQQISGCVDMRSVNEVLASDDTADPIKIFKMPVGWYAQEPRFVARRNGVGEDDGWLLSYVFDEAQLDSSGECPLGARSELWIIDAKSMKSLVGRVYLPQRVPYGLHGSWFAEEQVRNQRPIRALRTVRTAAKGPDEVSLVWKYWMRARYWVEETLT